MESTNTQTARPESAESRPAAPADLLVVLFTILGLESIILLHTLTPDSSTWVVMILGTLGTSATALLNPGRVKPVKPWEFRFFGAQVLGVVVGEAMSYLMLVPWKLTWACFTRSDHDVTATVFLRFVCLMLASSAWRMAHRVADREPRPTSRRGAAHSSGGLAMGLMATVGLALIPVVMTAARGHRPSRVVEAEWRAASQLGPDYGDYHYFVRHLEQVFRRKESVTIQASVIAYNADLGDVQDLTVTWKEPWN